MVDILERLRSPQTSLGTLWPQPNLHEEAADEITRLREENAAERLVAKDNLDWFNALKTDYDALREENARLREELQKEFNAMRVFARYRELEAEIETLRKTLIGVLAGFVASVDLLERGGKKAAPSDKMFAQMLEDYKNRIERGRAAVAAIREMSDE